MRRIEAPESHQAWHNKIIGQLAFIKKHIRYPFDRHMLLPFVFICSSLPLFVFIVYLTLNSRAASGKSIMMLLILGMTVLVPTILTFVRYLQTLKFIAIKALPTAGENAYLIQRFLREHHFAFSPHPEAAGVYRIISKNISSLKDEREVVFFIADAQRILINSHFTRSRLNAAVGSPHYRQVARMLNDWMRNTGAGSANGRDVDAYYGFS